jgi:hypothetical protein
VTHRSSTLADRFVRGPFSARRIVDEFRGMENLTQNAEASPASNPDFRPSYRRTGSSLRDSNWGIL